MKNASSGPEVSRRQALTRIGALGAGATAVAATRTRAYAQPKAPITLSFWTFDNPQQRPWLHKRVNQYMEKNPNVKVDFQWFTFADLGKKASVGSATGTAPDGFVTGDWLMPTWLARNLIAPLDVKLLGYPALDAFRKDHADAFVAGAIKDGQAYGYPLWFYGFCNYLNTKQFKEVGLDPVKDQPRTWTELGEVAKRLTIKQGNKFTRQGFKFAMHAAQWTMIQLNPIVSQVGGQWFDASGKCTINNEAGVKAMTIRASIARQYGAEDPADSIATFPLPQMDWLKERCSMFSCHPVLDGAGGRDASRRAEGHAQQRRHQGRPRRGGGGSRPGDRGVQEGLSYRWRIRLWGMAFVMPTILFFLVFKYGPMLWAMGLSFTTYDMMKPPRWVGLENYESIVRDPIFREALANTLVYIAAPTIFITLVGLGLALALNTRGPGRRACMSAMFLTNIMPILAVCLVWRFLFHPHGLLNQFLGPLGFGRLDWLTDSALAMPAIILVTVWRFAPYFMVVFLAGLLTIPPEYYEAAEIDGANAVRRFRYLTLPLLMPVTFFVVVVAALLSARIFLMPFIITGGGPGNATRVLSMLIYETGFSYMKMGRAAAISVVLFAIVMVLTLAQMRLFMRSEEEYS